MRYTRFVMAGVIALSGNTAAGIAPFARTAAATVVPDRPNGCAVVRDEELANWQQPTVVGVPHHRGGAGAVDVRDQGWVGDKFVARPPVLLRGGKSGDRFGATVVLADINRDLCTDLLIGAPGEGGGGAVHVVLGSPSGTATGGRFKLTHSSASGDAFGAAIAVGDSDVNLGEVADLWVGAPGVDVAGQADAGAVVHYRVTGQRITSGPTTVITQNSPGIAGGAERGDRFGEVLSPLTSALVVGVPREDLGVRRDAGMVVVLPAPGVPPAHVRSFIVAQDRPGVPNTPEAGDRFGAALDTVDTGIIGYNKPAGELVSAEFLVGVPGEDLGRLQDAGAAHSFAATGRSATSIAAVTQNSRGVPGRAEAGDGFGSSVLGAAVSLGCGGSAAIGVPGEDVGAVADAGAVNVYGPGDERTVDEFGCGSLIFDRGVRLAAGDRVGAALGKVPEAERTGDDPYESLLVGVPGDDIGNLKDAGQVWVPPIDAGRGVEMTLSAGAVASERYGSVLPKLHRRLTPPWIVL